MQNDRLRELPTYASREEGPGHGREVLGISADHHTDYQGSTHRHLGLARAAAHIRDPRLVLVARLRPGVFQDKRVLDVGCNNGAVTVQVG